MNYGFQVREISISCTKKEFLLQTETMIVKSVIEIHLPK